MTSMPIVRTGVAAVVLVAATLLQACSSQPDAMSATAQQSKVVAANSNYTGVYSGDEWDVALDAEMTSSFGGGD